MTAFVGARVLGTIGAADLLASAVGFSLGERFVAHDGKEYVFLKASAAIAQYDAITYDPTFQTLVAPVSTANDAGGNRIAVAPVAVASGDYFWGQVYGPAIVNALAACAANVRLNTTGTAGQLDDDGTATEFAIDGIVLTAARGGSAPTAAILNYPAQRVPVL